MFDEPYYSVCGYCGGLKHVIVCNCPPRCTCGGKLNALKSIPAKHQCVKCKKEYLSVGDINAK